MKDRDVIDALAISAFFLGYALVLSLSRRIPRPSLPADSKRMAFFRSMRNTLIEQENMTGARDASDAR